MSDARPTELRERIFTLDVIRGFASTEEGNTLTEGEQWAKLERIVSVAEEVWGRR